MKQKENKDITQITDSIVAKKEFKALVSRFLDNLFNFPKRKRTANDVFT